MRLFERLFQRSTEGSVSRRRFFRSLGLMSGVGLLHFTRSAEASESPVSPSPVFAEPYIGEIIMFAGNFAPRGWAFCDGQLLAIAQWQALFSILGTTYGGDGRTTFALPDLRGRFPIHPGQGPGLSSRSLGERSGSESVALTAAEIPSHSHDLNASTSEGAFDSPQNAVPGRPASGIPQYATGPNTTMAQQAIGAAGGGGGHDNMPPYLGVHFIIALTGLFPPRN